MRNTVKDLSSEWFKQLVEPFLGRHELWDRHTARLGTTRPVLETLDVVERRWPSIAGQDAARPIFVLSAGWRSGSTLVQRLLVSGGDSFIWGEPYTLGDHVGHLTESLAMFSENYPPEEFFFNYHKATSLNKLEERWIAHLYPEPSNLREAHRAFFMALLGHPAEQLGYSRWGFKECRYGIEHACYLKWLFPNAKFFFVYRNPLHAWRSFRLFGAYQRWPNDPIFTARRFGQLWRRLMSGFLDHHSEVAGMMVKYEDLIEGRLSCEDLAKHAGVGCDTNVLTDRISGRGDRKLVPVPRMERWLLAREVEPLASQMGYTLSESR